LAFDGYRGRGKQGKEDSEYDHDSQKLNQREGAGYFH
jgi:hypothetical protein